jgi:NADH:ubiquinone oxidoreductase subunit K
MPLPIFAELPEIGLSHYLILGALLFVCGVVCMATKRNAIGVLMGVELVLNGANVNFVAFASYNPAFQLEGQVFALFVIVLAAAEVGVGLAIVLQYYRLRKAIVLDEIALHEADQDGSDEPGDGHPGTGPEVAAP